ncbi:MAG: hypothetical protein V3S69_00545 [Dehalococcoidales bacterium]
MKTFNEYYKEDDKMKPQEELGSYAKPEEIKHYSQDPNDTPWTDAVALRVKVYGIHSRWKTATLEEKDFVTTMTNLMGKVYMKKLLEAHEKTIATERID